jgi:hypothetical protein
MYNANSNKQKPSRGICYDKSTSLQEVQLRKKLVELTIQIIKLVRE